MATSSNDAIKYLVVKTTYPTTYGCNTGLSWSRADFIAQSTTKVVARRSTYEKAVKSARQARNSSEHFFCYEVEDEDDDLPPFDSADMQNYDNDEEVLIRVLREDEFRQEQKDDKECLRNSRAK